MTQLADQVFDAARGWLVRNMEPVLARLKALEDRPIAKDGAPGEKGDPGVDGKDGAPGEKGADGAPGRDGVDGKDGAPGTPGERGEKGEKGDAGEPGAKGEPGEPGAKGADGINGKDGAPGKDGEIGQKGEPGLDGRDGQPGVAGKDALQLDVIDGIDPQKRYQRGTYAAFRGGIVRSFKATEPLGDGELEKAGWQVIVNGIDSEDEQATEDGRTVTRTTRYTSGKSMVRTFKTAVVIYRQIWKESEDYARGDSVTRDGSTWILMADEQKGKPGDEGSGWQLSVKRGRDGLRGEKGDRGAEGRAG